MPKNDTKTPILLRIEPETLERIDRLLAKHPGVPRAFWLRAAIKAQVEREERK